MSQSTIPRATWGTQPERRPGRAVSRGSVGVLVLASGLSLLSLPAQANGGHGHFGGRAGGFSSGHSGGGHSGGAHSGGAHSGGGRSGGGHSAAPSNVHSGGFSGARGSVAAPAQVAPPLPRITHGNGNNGLRSAFPSMPAPTYTAQHHRPVTGSALHNFGRPSNYDNRVPVYSGNHGGGYRDARVHSHAHTNHSQHHGAARWNYSAGFRPHHHRYPTIGLTVPALAVGAAALSYSGARLYFDRGIWYRPNALGNYIVTAPPYGAIVPVLPYDYATINYGGVPYYYGNGIYYTEVPGQGYAVTPAPQGLPPVSGNGYEPIPGSQGSTQGGLSGDSLALAQLPDVQIAPRADQSSAQLFSDRADCSRWAAGQSGFDPARGRPSDAQGWQNAKAYRESELSCLQARGYEAR